MAKQRHGINDAYRGTVGTVIGYEWRGKWCLRARPLHVHNPRTAKQQGNRLLFKQMVDLASRMKTALRKGLRGVSLGMHITECNLFVKRNKECFSLDAGRMPAVQGGEQRMVVEWENLIVSEGALAAPVFEVQDTLLSQPQVATHKGSARNTTGIPLPNLGEQRDSYGGSSSPSKLEGVDAKRTGACVQGTTIAFPFAPHAEGERASGDDEVYVWAYCPEAGEGVLSASAYRRTKSVTLTLPERWQGKEVHLYGFAVDYEGEASPTVYIGCLEAAPEEVQCTASHNDADDSQEARYAAPLQTELFLKNNDGIHGEKLIMDGMG